MTEYPETEYEDPPVNNLFSGRGAKKGLTN